MSTISDHHTPSIAIRRRPGSRLATAWKARGPLAVPPRTEWALGLRRLRVAGLILIALEFLGFCVWSEIQVHKFALTADYSLYQQAVYLMAHGHLWPRVTEGGAPLSFSGGHFSAFPLFTNEAEFFLVPIAVLYRIWPHLVVAKFAQDIAICGGQALAFLWMCELVAARGDRDVADRFRLSQQTGMWVLAFGLVLLIANPWFIMAASFDLHAEAFALPCVVGAGRALHKGQRRRALAWGTLGMLSSAVGTTYVVGIGLSAALTRRSAVRNGFMVAGLAFAWFVFLNLAGWIATAGPGLFVALLNGASGHLVWENGYWKPVGATTQNTTYGALLSTVATHPWNVFRALGQTHSSLWANVSASGVLGIVWLPTMIGTLAVLGPSSFNVLYLEPGFQNVVAYGLIAVGTVAAAIWILRRSRRAGFIVMTLLAINTAVWGIIWFPHVSTEWAAVTPGAASTLSRAEKLIGPSDEVVASQGISGVFSDRQSSYAIMENWKRIHVTPGDKVWFVVAPFDGIETTEASVSIAMIERLAQTPGMHLRLDENSVWVFEWTPPAGVHKFRLTPVSLLTAPAWALPGPSGRAVMKGPTSSAWYVTSTGVPGYVFARALWRVPAGHYKVSATLSASAVTNVEVWDTTQSRLLKRVVVSATHGKTRLSLPVVMTHTGHQPYIGGSLLWSDKPIMNIGDSLELRVWTAGPAGSVSVYDASITGRPS
jgi:hypothetical protein